MSASRRAPGGLEGQSLASSRAVVGIWGQEVWAGCGEGPVLTGHIGHLYLQALDVSHVHIEERLGLGDGAPDARQGDVGETAAAVHCGPGKGTEEEAVREEECASPPSQPAAPSSEQPASKDVVEALLRAVLQPESPRGSGILRGQAGPRAFRVPQQNPISSDTNGALQQQTDSVQSSPPRGLAWDLALWTFPSLTTPGCGNPRISQFPPFF